MGATASPAPTRRCSRCGLVFRATELSCPSCLKSDANADVPRVVGPLGRQGAIVAAIVVLSLPVCLFWFVFVDRSIWNGATLAHRLGWGGGLFLFFAVAAAAKEAWREGLKMLRIAVLKKPRGEH
jgi:hypothetical protein